MKTGWQNPFIVLQTGEVPVILESAPGTAKSSIMKDFAKQMGRRLYHLFLNARDREDIRGYPVVDEKTGQVELKMDRSLRGITRGSLIFLDELNTAPKHVAVLAQRLLSEGYIGERKLRDAWLAGAMNPPGQSPNARALEPAIVNRVAIFDWKVPADVWRDYILLGQTSAHKFIKLDREAYLNELSVVSAQVAVWLTEVRPEILDQQPGTRPFCSRRSATLAMKAMAAVRACGGDYEDCKEVATATAGELFASAYMEWEAKQHLPKASEILAQPAILADLGPISRHIALVSLPVYVIGRAEAEELIPKLISILDKYADSSPEAVMIALRNMVAHLRRKGYPLPVMPPRLETMLGEFING